MANQKITYLDTDLKSFRTVGDLFFFLQSLSWKLIVSLSVYIYLYLSVCLSI